MRMPKNEQLKRINESLDADIKQLSEYYKELELSDIEELLESSIKELQNLLNGYRTDLDYSFSFNFIIKRIERLERIYFLLIRIRDGNTMKEEIQNE